MDDDDIQGFASRAAGVSDADQNLARAINHAEQIAAYYRRLARSDMSWRLVDELTLQAAEALWCAAGCYDEGSPQRG